MTTTPGTTDPTWSLLEAVLPHAERVLLYGPPGTGKSHLAERTGLDGRRVFTVTLTAESAAEALTGHYVVAGGGTFLMVYGPAALAMLVDGRLVVNEADKPRGDALDALHVCLDSADVARLTLPVLTPAAEARLLAERGPDSQPTDSEWTSAVAAMADDLVTITPRSRRYQAVATMNGDPIDLPEPVADRLAIKANVTTPNPAAIEALPPDLRALARAKAGTRRPSDGRWWTLRPFFAFADLREHVGPDLASRAIFGDDAAAIADAVAIAAAKVPAAMMAAWRAQQPQPEPTPEPTPMADAIAAHGAPGTKAKPTKRERRPGKVIETRPDGSRIIEDAMGRRRRVGTNGRLLPND